MDRNYYHDHALTIAQHPSETDERMLLRIIAFALNASDELSFTRGISTEDEPDIWQKNLSDEIELWIELGQPDDKRVRKACGRAEQVIVYTYKSRSAGLWWEQAKGKLARFSNLELIHLQVTDHQLLENMAARNMQLQCTIQDGSIWISDATNSVEIGTRAWE